MSKPEIKKIIAQKNKDGEWEIHKVFESEVKTVASIDEAQTTLEKFLKEAEGG